jgi:hypothetical protein
MSLWNICNKSNIKLFLSHDGSYRTTMKPDMGIKIYEVLVYKLFNGMRGISL